jgi:hypothetical protein
MQSVAYKSTFFSCSSSVNLDFLTLGTPADQQELDKRMEQLRAEEKRLTRLLAEKGAGPARMGPGTLSAMLNLKDSGRKGTGSSGSDSDDA